MTEHPIQIDFYSDTDLDNLYSLFTEWDKTHVFNFEIFRQSIRNLASRPDNRIIVAKDEGAIAGYAQIETCLHVGFEPYIEVIQLLVAENRRNLGIGKQLMDFVERLAVSESIPMVKLSSQVHRSAAHVFYENRGYSYFKISKFYEKKLPAK